MTLRPRLRSLLIIINLAILLLPLGGITVLRIYENELVRQTETELIGQISLISAAFKDAYRSHQKHQQTVATKSDKSASSLADNPEEPSEPALDGIMPIQPRLDLAHSLVLPPASPPTHTSEPPDPIAILAGKDLATLIATARRSMLSGCRIVDRYGLIVASSANDTGLSISTWDEVAKALAGEPNSQLRTRKSKHPQPAMESVSRGAKIRVFVAHPVLVDNRIVGAVIMSRTPLDVAKAMYLIRSHLFKATLAIIAVALGISLLVAYYLNRPLKNLIRQAEKAQAGQGFDYRTASPPGILEFEQLADAMTRMAATIEARSNYIKTFATTVSHEFKTPLASMHGAIELLREHYEGMSQEERDNFIQIIDQETGRLELLVARLLELARADAYRPGDEQASLMEILENTANQYQTKGLSISYEGEGCNACVSMSPDVLSTIFINLFGNSLMHNGPNITIAIITSCRKRAGHSMVEIIISDNGKGISAGNTERIFKPFFTTAKDKGGSGLGLAIIKSLLEAHGGSIDLLPAVKGASFRLLVPIWSPF